MKYILKNIRNFIQEEIAVFILLCLSIIGSVIILHAAYGIYCAVSRDVLDTLYGSSDLTIIFSDSLSPNATKGELLTALSNIDVNIIDGLQGVTVEGWFPDDEHIFENEFDFAFRYKAGKMTCVNQIYYNLKKSQLWRQGSYFNETQYENGELVAIAASPHEENGEIQWPSGYKYKPVNGYIEVNGQKYKCIGQANAMYTPMIPFTTVTDNFVVDWVVFGSDGVMKRREYEAIADALLQSFPGVEIPEYPIPNADETMVYKSIMVICVLIVVISALVYAVLYQYIMERRKRTLDILRLSGLTLKSAQRIYMGECALFLIVGYGISFAVFNFWLLPELQKVYYYLGDVFSAKAYIKLGIIYFVVVYLILKIKLWIAFSKTRMIERI